MRQDGRPAPAGGSRALPPELIGLICKAAARQCLQSLQHVSAAWRAFSLPLLWRSVEIDEWECRASACQVHTAYGRYVQSLEFRRYHRPRASSTGTPPPAAHTSLDPRTKTEVLCEWLGMRWESVHQVVVGTWPPYNVSRVQKALAFACPHLRVLVLEGAAAAWASTMERAVAAHPQLREFHASEDSRALLPPAEDRLYKRQAHFSFLSKSCTALLTHLTVPCLADSIGLLLDQLPRFLPVLQSLDLRQVDASISGRLHISVPPLLTTLRISGHRPLNAQMLSSSSTSPAYNSPCLQLQEIAQKLRSLVVVGPRSSEAARREFEQFWSVILRHKWIALRALIVPVALSELGHLVRKMCPVLEHLRMIHIGHVIEPHQNVQWIKHLTQLPCLRHLDVASSNNEYEGCCLSPRLVSEVAWNAPWLHTLYLSRLRLTADALQSLVQMLPYLHTLWFTFDAESSAEISDDCQDVPSTATECCLQYLIIHAMAMSEESTTRDADDSSCGPFSSTLALCACLRRLPTLGRCRLPMFTFPDKQRRWLQGQFAGIEFVKYAPPY